MKTSTILTTLTLLATTALATPAPHRINRVRQAAPEPEYTLTYTSNDFPASNTVTSTGGVIDVSVDVLQSFSIQNPANDAVCHAVDQWGNQVRAIGGNRGVDAATLDAADGRQVVAIHCDRDLNA